MCFSEMMVKGMALSSSSLTSDVGKAKATAKTIQGFFAVLRMTTSKQTTATAEAKAGWLRVFIPTLCAIKPTRRMGHPLLRGWSGESNSNGNSRSLRDENKKGKCNGSKCDLQLPRMK
jgi:hypothetical protein